MTRRGHTLIELLAVMTATMTLLGVTAGLLHRGLRTQSAARHLLEWDHASLVLARHFRQDVAAATSIDIPEEVVPTAVDSRAPIIRLQLPEAGEVTYRVGFKALLRHQEFRSAAGPRHEAYRMPAEMVWQVRQQGQLVQLSGQREGSPQARPHDVEIVAALAVRGNSHPGPFSIWATPENAERFRSCWSPLPAAADLSHGLLAEADE